MTRTVLTNYVAVNGRGVELRSFDTLERGRAWVRDNAFQHDGLRLDLFTLSARPAYRPRVIRPREDFSIPALA